MECILLSSWDCLQEGHEPASCENWKDWFDKVAEIKPEECKRWTRLNERSEYVFCLSG